MTSPQERPGESNTELLARLFDLRTFTGTLFLIFGVIVSIVGLGASDADIAKAAGINISLLIGVVMLVAGVIFISWMMIKPPELLHRHEMSEDDLPEQLRHQGLEAIPEHSSDLDAVAETPPRRPRRRQPPAH